MSIYLNRLEMVFMLYSFWERSGDWNPYVHCGRKTPFLWNWTLSFMLPGSNLGHIEWPSVWCNLVTWFPKELKTRRKFWPNPYYSYLHLSVLNLNLRWILLKPFFQEQTDKMSILAEFDDNSIMLWPTCVTLNDLQQAVDNSDAD